MTRHSAIAYSLAPIIVSALGFVVVPLLSWWLPENDMALFAIFQANANFFGLVVSLGLDQALAREFHETAAPYELLKKILRMVALAVPVGLGALLVLKFGSEGRSGASVTPVMMGACVLLLFNRIYSSFMRMSGHGVAFAVDIVTPKLLQLILIAVMGRLALQPMTYELVVGIIAASAAVALGFEAVMAKRIARTLGAGVAATPRPPARARDLLRFSMPLIPGALAYYAISASAIYIVGLFGSARDVVVTALAISLGGGFVVLQAVFSTVWAPFAYRWHARQGNAALYGQIATMVTMGCAVCLLLSLYLVPYLSLVFPAKYHGLERFVIPVVVWNLFYLISIVGSFGIGIKRMSFTSMFVAFAGAALSIGLSALMTGRFGALGALLSVLTAFGLTLVLNCELSSRGWIRIVAVHHYIMVICMSLAGVAFSLGYAWQAKLILFLSVLLYLPKFRSHCRDAYALHKHFA